MLPSVADFGSWAAKAWDSGDRRAFVVIFEEFNLSQPEHWLSELLVRSQYPATERIDRTIRLGGTRVRGWGEKEEPRVFFSPAPDYLLRVKGDSMRDEGILSGDLIGVHRTRDARSGQIVVARIDEEITVKLLKIGKDGIRLLPRNPDYAPIVVKPDQDFAIEGLYCGLVRPNR